MTLNAIKPDGTVRAVGKGERMVNVTNASPQPVRDNGTTLNLNDDFDPTPMMC
ncbi:hypothetical protein [Rhodococcus gordoniae]|uniref:hypothetical protein n=1 Tax=Rhodococcus gordoniae TaxID=223392 RepID=UPI00352346EF